MLHRWEAGLARQGQQLLGQEEADEGSAPEGLQALALPGLRAGPVDLEDMKAAPELRPALGEGVETGAEDDVLIDTAGRLGLDQIFDEAGAREDGGAEGPGEGAHVGATLPAGLGGGELQADAVVEDVRGWVCLQVQGAAGPPSAGIRWADAGRALRR